jgi:hypothetical protein
VKRLETLMGREAGMPIMLRCAVLEGCQFWRLSPS